MALPIGIGLTLLLVPGIWLFGRVLFVSAAAVLAEPAAPLQLLQRCWHMTAGNGAALTLFLVLGLLGVVGIGLMAEGAGAALDVVARFVGMAQVGRFLHALMPGIGSCFVSVGVAAASAIAYRQLAAASR